VNITGISVLIDIGIDGFPIGEVRNYLKEDTKERYSISFNTEYLMQIVDAINTCDQVKSNLGKVTFSLDVSTKGCPILISGFGIDNGKSILMPLKMNNK
jgi:hypothetical protein